jgi:hypothetical protein
MDPYGILTESKLYSYRKRRHLAQGSRRYVGHSQVNTMAVQKTEYHCFYVIISISIHNLRHLLSSLLRVVKQHNFARNKLNY